MKSIIFMLLLAHSMLFSEGFTLKSNSISGQLGMKQVANVFGCKGDNISPDLSWKNAPKGVKSFAITAYDPDAPTGSGWWHWVVFDIPKNASSIKKNAGIKNSKFLPKGSIQGLTDFGFNYFGGACPPVGDKAHKYIFTVYALKVKNLGVKKNSSPALIGFMLNANAIEKSSISAYYGR